FVCESSPMIVRRVAIDELSQVFRLTYELASGGSVTRHVVACKRDPKLRSGTHWVLDNGRGEFLATLTTYHFRHPDGGTAVGLATLFTPEPLRRRGYARQLLEGVLAQLESEDERIFYLLSDIGSDFYERLGFRRLPMMYEGAPDCIPMLRCPEPEWERLSTHGQFLRGLMAFVD